MVDATVVGGYRSTKSAFGDEYLCTAVIAAVVFLLTYKILAKCERYALRFLKPSAQSRTHFSSLMRIVHPRCNCLIAE